jgi:hypothetical protein
MEFLNDIVDAFGRAVDNLGGRIGGPMKLRLVLQPLMAIIFAVRAGVKDGRAGAPPYFWAMFGSKEHRRALLREGWHDVGKIFVIAVVIDVIYQIIVARWVYPGEALFVAAVLAFVPYVLLRGLVTRLTRRAPAPAPRTEDVEHRGAA